MEALDSQPVQDYLRRTLRTWIGLPVAEPLDVRVPERLARLLLRAEEYERPARDQFGCWEYGLSENFWDGRLWTAELDRFAAERRAELAGRADLAPLWPESRPFAVCLTHDVDFVSGQLTPGQALRFARAGLVQVPGESKLLRAARPPGRVVRSLVAGIRRRPATAAALDRCIALEREYGVRSTYFFTVFPDEGFSRYDCVYLPGDRCRFEGRDTTVAEVMRRLASEGFDVGLHGSFNSGVVPGLLAREKAVLEDALGSPVTTTRQHFLHWDVRATPRLQLESGLAADSSLGFNRAIGFRAGTSLPFRHFDLAAGRELPLLEVPLVIHDGPLVRTDGLGLDEAGAIEAALRIVREVEASGALATVLLHPNSISEPRFEAVYRALLDYAVERGAWVASLREVAEWWSEREARHGLNAS
jgi:peptidoglycan/xylan/chitin deacetylase (PgdA/CDA1 family)